VHFLLGAIDGIAVKIKAPSSRETHGNPQQYYNGRKSFHSIVCQASVGHPDLRGDGASGAFFNKQTS
jgi:hypothetical protein